MDRIPCRASVDLRQHQAEQDYAEPLEPDFSEVDDLRDFVRVELREPLAQLFSTRDQIRTLQRSDAFGNCINLQKALSDTLADIDAIEAVLQRMWEAS